MVCLLDAVSRGQWSQSKSFAHVHITHTPPPLSPSLPYRLGDRYSSMASRSFLRCRGLEMPSLRSMSESVRARRAWPDVTRSRTRAVYWLMPAGHTRMADRGMIPFQGYVASVWPTDYTSGCIVCHIFLILGLRSL